MKKILLSSVAFLGLTAGAFAADLPSRVVPAPIAAVPIFTWTGFYVGVNAGYGWGNNSDDVVFVAPGTVAAPFGATTGTIAFTDANRDGFVGGGQIGYNYQFGAVVVGVEADIQWADLGNGGVGVVTTGTFPVGFVPASRGNGLDWFGTVRGRLGFAFDRALVYATGGFAYGGGGDSNGINNDDTTTGWALGGGVEYAFTNNLTLGLEGLWVNLDRDRNDVVGFVGATPVVATGIDNNEDDFFVARAKVNFKF
jgi:outer membrane immunogenic protein